VKPKVTRVEKSEWLRGSRYVSVRIEWARGWCEAIKREGRGEKSASVNYNGGWFYPGDEGALFEALRFAAQIARRLDAGETISEGEVYDG